MNKTSSVVTGSATVAAAAIAPAIEWLANTRLQLAMPPQVVLIVAAALVTLGHLVVNLLNGKLVNRPESGSVGVAPVAGPSSQGGFARIGMMVSLAILALVVSSMLGGCSLLSATIGQYEKDGGQIVVQSAERTVCKDIPIGIWLDQYGSNPTRLAGWQAICGNPVKNPLDPGTVAAILKVYPDFQQAVDATTTAPQLPVAPPVAIAPVAQASAPAVVKATRRPRPVVPPASAQSVVVPRGIPPLASAPLVPAQTSLLSPAVKP